MRLPPLSLLFLVVIHAFAGCGEHTVSPDAMDASGLDGFTDPLDGRDGPPSPLRGLMPLHPRTGWDVTDFALSFRWVADITIDENDRDVTAATSYQLMVDDDIRFQSPEIDVLQGAPVASHGGDEEMFAHWNHIAYTPPDTLPPGTWHWRVRVAESDTWSPVSTFALNNEHSKAPPVREIGPLSPLFSFDMFYDTGNDPLLKKLPALHQRFPESVRPFVAFAIQHEPMGMHPALDDGYAGTFTDLLEPLSLAGVPVLIKDGGPDKDFQQFGGLTEIEHIFKTQPNVLGLVLGETFWDFIDGVDSPLIQANQVNWYRNAFLLAAKYGRVVVFGNGNDEDFVWDVFLGKESGSSPWMTPDTLRDLAPYLVMTPKNNIPFGYYEAESAIVGAWLTDMFDNWGVWSEGWAWGSVGYGSLFGPQLPGNAEDPDFSTMPYALWIQMKLAGLSEGATVFHFGGESSVVEWGVYNPTTGHFDVDDDEILRNSTAFWDMEGNEHPALERHVFPFLEAIVTQTLIPTRAEVLAKVKVAVAAPPPESDKGSALDYGAYAALYRYTMDITDHVSLAEVRETDPDIDYYDMVPNACRRELLHNEGRHYVAPVLPYPIAALSDDTLVLSLAEVAEHAVVEEIFSSNHPLFSTGTAWVVEVGGRIYITNSHENTDLSQSFSFQIEGMGTVSGEVQPHSWILLRKTPEALWIMANAGSKGAYTDDRTTRLTLTMTTEPTVEVSRGVAIPEWTAGSLDLKMPHQAGASEVTLLF